MKTFEDQYYAFWNYHLLGNIVEMWTMAYIFMNNFSWSI